MRKKILLKGPILTRSGYGEQTRFALRALRSREDLFDIYIQPLKWGQTSWTVEDTEERKWIDKAIERAIGFIQQGGQFDLSLQVTIPNEWERMAPVNIGYTAGIETTHVAPEWLQRGNEMVDKIIVVSRHSKNTYESTLAMAVNSETKQESEYRLYTPIDVVGYPVKTFDNLPELDIDLDFDFNFLAIAQFGPRKNIPNTIKWFIEEFRDEEVGLVVKTNIAKNCLMDREKVLSDLKHFIGGLTKHRCKVYLLHGDMTEEEIHALYVHPKIKAFVALPHGEGFGLPIFEAAYSGMPVVATGWSGQMDFLVGEEGREHFHNVAFDLQKVQESVVWDGVIIKDCMWAYTREQSAKKHMRRCYEEPDRHNPREYATKLHERFGEELMYKKFISAMGFRDTNFEVDYIFVSDMFTDQHLGGAELSLQTLIDNCPVGKSHEKLNSFRITKSIIDNNLDSLWVFGNIAQLSDELIQYIIDKKIKYYFVEYDYKYCEYRNPVLYRFLEEEDCDYSETEKGKLIEQFVNNSAKTFFMSEAQSQTYANHLTDLNADKTIVLSSTFGESFFDKIDSLNEKHKEAERTKWIVLGSRSWIKGTQEAENWCKENDLDYEVVSNISHNEMLEKLATAKGICFKPTGLDTCPRFVIEAKLLGCELELNENVQHLEEPWFDTEDTNVIVEYLKNRKDFFWSQVE